MIIKIYRRIYMNKLKTSLLVIAASVFISAPTYAADIEACLITKTDIKLDIGFIKYLLKEKNVIS